MGKITAIYLDKFDEPIFDNPYEIYTPKRFSSKEKPKKNVDVEIMRNKLLE